MQNRSLLVLLALLGPAALVAGAAEPDAPALDARFTDDVRPFLAQYCVSCHNTAEPEADLDLERYGSMEQAAKDTVRWAVILEKLESKEMPPRKAKAKAKPTDDARHRAVEWFRA